MAKSLSQLQHLTLDTLLENLTSLSRLNVDYKDLPTFDGTNSSFKSFLNDFEDLSHLAKWTDEEKLAILPTRLKRRPKFYFRRLKADQKKTYKIAIEELSKMFDSRQINSMMKRELHSAKQGDETLLDYLERIEYLFTELEIESTEQIDFMIAGLNPELQDYIFLKLPLSYEQAVNSLILRQSLIERRAVVSDDNPSTEKQLTDEEKEETKQDFACWICNTPGHFKRNCWITRKHQKTKMVIDDSGRK